MKNLKNRNGAVAGINGKEKQEILGNTESEEPENPINFEEQPNIPGEVSTEGENVLPE